MQCYNSSCYVPSAGIASSNFASAVKFFAAAQCMVSEGIYPEADIEDFARFDFIIVGAGSAGCVVANRLSENKDWHILLIEAGGDPPIEAAIPGFHVDIYNTKYNWGYKTENDGVVNQANINGSINWPRGKMFGGSSNNNAMIYIKGNPADYQRWQDAGNPEWNLDDIRRCFKKQESFQDQKLNQIPEINRQYGHDGPLVINTFNSTYRNISNKVLSAFNEIGIKNVQDLNVANVFGSGIMRATASNGERNSVSKGYLQPIKNRENLIILKNSLVTKVLLNASKQAIGVVVKRNCKTLRIYANKEVIISAGVINSPQLLMLSGIGPEKHLKSKSIPTQVDLPMVGQNLRDHFLLPTTVYTDETNLETDADLQFEVIKYFYDRSGYLAQQIVYDILAFFSLNKAAKYPDFEIYVLKIIKNKSNLREYLVGVNQYKNEVADSIVELNKNYSLYVFQVSLLHPYSSGNISLRSKNPKDHPLIYPNYFKDPRDLELTVSGIEKVLELLNTTYFKSVNGFLGRIKFLPCDKFELGSREYLKCIAISVGGTVYHPVGTCKMGTNSSNSVVSSRLRVHGVKNLRVIDVSVMPNHVSGNTNGPCVMIGERGAELIKEDH